MVDQNSKNKISAGIKFLIVVLVLYLFIFLFNFPLAKNAFTKTLLMFVKIIPLLVFVFSVMSILNLFFTEERVKKHMGEDSGIGGWLYAVVSGILIAGPPYVLYPFLKTLKDRGMKDALIAVFLFNRNIKIPFLPVMVFYFSFAYTLVLSVYIIIFSIFNGMLVGFFMKKSNQ